MKMRMFFLACLFVLGVIGCSKSPVGPTMSGMGAPSVSQTSSNTTSSDPATGEATTVSSGNQNTAVESKNTGSTGVDSVSVSKAVDSSVTSVVVGNNTDGGSTSTLTVDVNDTIMHPVPIPTVSSKPSIHWNASGVGAGSQLVYIAISRLSDNEIMWIVDDIPRSLGSVNYGSTSGGTVMSACKPLTPGSYILTVEIHDDALYTNHTYGGINFTVQ